MNFFFDLTKNIENANIFHSQIFINENVRNIHLVKGLLFILSYEKI